MKDFNLERVEPFWYLATPYRGHTKGIKVAYKETLLVLGMLLELNIRVYSPIVHCHDVQVSIIKLEKGTEHNFWLPHDAPFMHASVGLMIVRMAGWKDSEGIAEEVNLFKILKKPIVELDWPLGS